MADVFSGSYNVSKSQNFDEFLLELGKVFRESYLYGLHLLYSRHWGDKAQTIGIRLDTDYYKEGGG